MKERVKEKDEEEHQHSLNMAWHTMFMHDVAENKV